MALLGLDNLKANGQGHFWVGRLGQDAPLQVSVPQRSLCLVQKSAHQRHYDTISGCAGYML